MSFYRSVRGLLFLMSAEMAHILAIKALKWNLVPAQQLPFDERLKNTVWGIEFKSPVGMAAGFDKNAEVIEPLSRQGFGFVEVGTVTPKPQKGNPRPRLFRLKQDRAVINRMGFNNKGADFFVEQLKKRPFHVIVGANIGKNKTTEDAVQDYCLMLEKVYGLSDYIVINISSPNTPGLRTLQEAEVLDTFIKTLLKTKALLMQKYTKNIPLLIKIDPDSSDTHYAEIGRIFLENKVDGIIVSNTTVQRFAHLRSFHKEETGGLSGEPLRGVSLDALKHVYYHTKGKIPIIGVGGVASGLDAYHKIRAGASLVQLYSSLVYEGFGLLKKIHQELGDLLAKDGFKNIKEAIGVDVKL